VAAGTTDVTLIRAQSRTNPINYDVASDTTTATAPTALDLAGGGTRYASQNDVTIYTGTITNYTSAADRYNLSISPSSAFGTGATSADGLAHPTELWFDTDGDGIVDTLIATDSTGDGVWDLPFPVAGYDTDSNNLPDVPVPANSTRAYELRRTIPSAMRFPQDYVTLTARPTLLANSGQVDSVTAQMVLVTVTRASIRGLRVDPAGKVEFATGEQHNTAGFNIYEVAGPRQLSPMTRLNDQMVKAPVSTSFMPTLYEVRTHAITQPYIMIEELEVAGQHRLMGPFAIADAHLGKGLEKIETLLDKAAQGAHTDDQSRRLTANGLRSLATTDKSPARDVLARWRAALTNVAGAQGAKVQVTKPGQVRVSLAQLQAAGLPPGSFPSLRLTHLGQPVAFTRSIDPFGGTWLTFKAESLSTDYTGQNVYIFTMDTAAVPPAVVLTRSETPPASNVRRIQKNTLYDPLIPFGTDPWLWDILLPGLGPWPYGGFGGPDFGSFDLPSIPAGLTGNIPVHIQVLGGTYHQHQVVARINGTFIGTVTWSGGVSVATINGTIPASSLLATGNQLSLDYTAYALPDGMPADSAVAGLNYVDLELPTAGTPTAVFDLAPYNPTLADTHGVEYLIITHPLFHAQANRMASVKQAQGFRTQVVDVDQAYDRYSGGVVEGESVRALIRYMAATSPKLKYVLLIGDDSFDPQDYTGYGSVSYVPSVLAFDGIFGRIPSENMYADVNGDGKPDLAIGRLPVQTAAQADAMIDKIVAYTATPRLAVDRHIFAVDNTTPTDAQFRLDAQREAARLATGSNVTWVDVGDGIGIARTSLQSQWAAGAFALHYFGHGGVQQWADEQLLTTDDAAALTTARPPIVFQWACEAGWYQYLFGPSLAESIVLAPHAGAVASFAPTGITSPAGQSALYDEVYKRLNSPSMTLGELIQQSKIAAVTANPRLRSTVIDGWSLLGDPALPLAP
jgi:hypothetical protein